LSEDAGVNHEFGTRDLGGQLDGLNYLVLVGDDGALQSGVCSGKLLADIEPLGEELDQAQLDDDIGVGPIRDETGSGPGGVDGQVVSGLWWVRLELDRLDLDHIRRFSAVVPRPNGVGVRSAVAQLRERSRTPVQGRVAERELGRESRHGSRTRDEERGGGAEEEHRGLSVSLEWVR